jgi:hypothetical protein
LHGPRGEKLDGTWSSASSRGTALTGMSFYNSGITFTPDGRFEKFSNGSSTNSTMAQTINDTFISTSYDDEGTSVSASTPGVVVAQNSKNGKRGSDRRGTYSFDGYVVTLRYDNGKVQRLPFFFQTNSRSLFYFDDDSMSKDKPAKK